MSVANRLKLALAALIAFSAASCSTSDGEGAGFNDEPLAAEANQKRVFILQADLEKTDSEAGEATDLDELVRSSLNIARLRIENFGSPLLWTEYQGNGRVLVTTSEPESRDLVERVFGIPTPLDLRIVDETARLSDLVLGNVQEGSEIISMADGTPIAVRKRGGMEGVTISNTSVAWNTAVGEPAVNVRLDVEGRRQFAALTDKNVGRKLAIVLDGEILSTPIIQEPIRGGLVQISGNFTQESANELAISLAAGRLPADFEIVEERVLD